MAACNVKVVAPRSLTGLLLYALAVAVFPLTGSDELHNTAHRLPLNAPLIFAFLSVVSFRPPRASENYSQTIQTT